MIELPTDSSSKFLTFLGLIVLYGGVTYGWNQLEIIDDRSIEIKVLEKEFEERQDFVDEITDAREWPVFIDIIKTDEVLFKKFVGDEFFDEKIDDDESEFKSRFRAAIESNPDKVAELMRLRAPSSEDVEALDGRLLNLELQKQRLKLKSESLQQSKKFYWLYLSGSVFLGVIFLLLGFKGWKATESYQQIVDNPEKKLPNQSSGTP